MNKKEKTSFIYKQNIKREIKRFVVKTNLTKSFIYPKPQNSNACLNNNKKLKPQLSPQTKIDKKDNQTKVLSLVNLWLVSKCTVEEKLQTTQSTERPIFH